MARLLRMPEVAANTLEATLSEWLLAEQAEFADGDAIATVETDKAAVEVPVEGAGVLVRTLVGPGTTVAVGAPVALIAAPGETVADVDATLAELGGTSAPATVDDPDAPVQLAGQTPPTEMSGPPDAAPPNGTPDARPSNGTSNGAPSNGAPPRIMSSPLARRLVREHGLRLEDLTGTGPGGRIVRDDVRRAVAARERATVSPPAPDAQPDRPQRTEEWEDVPHTRMRRAIATRLGESNREAPHFAIRGSARVDSLLALRAQLNAGDDQRVTVNDLVVAAVARTHARLPEMNVIWTPDAVRRYAAVDVGIAVATDRGLVTPVLRGVETRTVSSIARDAADLTERARAGALRQDELEGGTITVSNLGGYGTEEFTAVLNPPQAAILAVGAARKQAVVDGDTLAVATVLKMTLTVDHRPVDGALAARWMAAFIALLEDPLRILA
ncbi:MAG TPA: dihydrolipoamide acetyltransferase family protein [Mycobacteriales bacterium]|nr:dihydrolipoamide acetyltransferase family protein [Mycobacteriales bacterium]